METSACVIGFGGLYEIIAPTGTPLTSWQLNLPQSLKEMLLFNGSYPLVPLAEFKLHLQLSRPFESLVQI